MTLAVGTRIDPPLAGASTTNGTTGRTITLAYELSTADYHVSITPTAAQAGQFGEYWIGSKTTTGFTVYNDGATGLAFTYAVTRY
jgi:hypothetical protein